MLKEAWNLTMMNNWLTTNRIVQSCAKHVEDPLSKEANAWREDLKEPGWTHKFLEWNYVHKTGKGMHDLLRYYI